MIKSLYKLFFLTGILALVSWLPTSAQQPTELTPKKGLEYIDAGDFGNAQMVYAHLLKKYPSDPGYNFYMGICLISNRDDIPQAVKNLNFAKLKKVSRNVYFYLGRAHQLSYRFDEAIANYTIFLKNAPADDDKIEEAKLYLVQCENSRKMASKIYELTVLDKSPITKNKLLEKYRPVKDVGKLRRNGDFFDSGVNPDNVMFETERGDVVYFAMTANTQNSLSIFKMEKWLDGWGDSKILGNPVNSEHNDAFPFMATDGFTFYFASDRPGGFGGYDMYKAYFDNETQSFLEPINLGVPFNSPDDDFLFVSDEFNQVAWFASNRETRGDALMVYTIKWDGSEVRNMADNANQVTESAKLMIVAPDGTKKDGKNLRNTYSAEDKDKNKGLIRFEINDTIVYSKFEDFISAEALQFFKDGYKKEHRMDSLSVLMKGKRSRYSNINDETQRNKIVNEILALENQVYSLEDEIQEKYLYARTREMEEIKNRVSQSTYRPIYTTGIDNVKSVNFDGIFIPEKYTFHSTDEFQRHFLQQENMYKKLFSSNDIATLRYADSLYVWANILNLESAKLMEESSKVEETEGLKLAELIKNADSLNDAAQGEGMMSKMIKESRELKMLSTRLYHKSLDKKFPVYYLKLKDASRNLNEANSKEILQMSQQGNAYFREAKNILDEPTGLNLESYEKAGTIKRAGIEKQEKALRMYGNLDPLERVGDGIIEQATIGIPEDTNEVTSHSENLVVNRPISTEQVSKSLQQSADVTKEDVFKIQIGVFKNAPNREVLIKIPEVSTLELEGSGLTKYFTGSFKTYEEAQKGIPGVIEAGFKGAFVVYFKGSKLSPIPQN